jgi:hypothetical protein
MSASDAELFSELSSPAVSASAFCFQIDEVEKNFLSEISIQSFHTACSLGRVETPGPAGIQGGRW